MSFVDYRSIGSMDPGTCADRGVVSMQLADASGAPVGPWMRLEPSTNVHDQVPFTGFVNATFDPVDDGNTGDDLYPPFEPTDLSLRRGPSSTCADERVFAWMGSTTGAFDPLGVGGADGPGLQGASGPGTWVETIYDLSRYRGRSVRIRFVASTTRLGSFLTMQALFGSNNVRWEDGWWIDDVTFSGATAAAGVVANDTHDNSGLTVDADLDGVDDVCDDNCVGTSNPSQADFDLDGLGDACDPDDDADTIADVTDNCPFEANPTQDDDDLDGVGDVCDVCPDVVDPLQADSDGDGGGNACDCAPSDPAIAPDLVEMNDGIDNQCPGDADYGLVDEVAGPIGFFDPNSYALSWPAQPLATGYTVVFLTGIRYASATCSGSALIGPEATYQSSGAVPPVGRTSYILVQARTPHAGSWGRASNGVERAGLCGYPP
jgi:hypothetical protein